MLEGEIINLAKGLCQSQHFSSRTKICYKTDKVSGVRIKVFEQRRVFLAAWFAGIVSHGFQRQHETNIIATLAYGFGSGGGWFIAFLAVAGIRLNLYVEFFPAGLRGPGITLIIAGLMALAFIGFTGVLQ